MRTTAGKRPVPQDSELTTLTGQQVLDWLMSLGVDGPRAMRMLKIAREVGIKAEVIPGKGIWTIRLVEGGYSLVNKPVLL